MKEFLSGFQMRVVKARLKLSLKVTVHLQTDHFVEILIFRLMYRSKHRLMYRSKHDLSPKILKNIKYWQRNGGFKFWRPGSKNYPSD